MVITPDLVRDVAPTINVTNVTLNEQQIRDILNATIANGQTTFSNLGFDFTVNNSAIVNNLNLTNVTVNIGNFTVDPAFFV